MQTMQEGSDDEYLLLVHLFKLRESRFCTISKKEKINIIMIKI